MAKTVACVVVRSPALFSFLGHMTLMHWSLTQLQEARGVDRIVCVALPELAARAKVLLATAEIEVSAIPKAVTTDDALERWVTAADGPAGDAAVVVLDHCTSPFLPAAKIEACVRQVASGKSSTCVPARDAHIVVPTGPRQAVVRHAIAGLKVFRVAVPVEAIKAGTVKISLTESLSVDNLDEFFLVSAMVDGNRI